MRLFNLILLFKKITKNYIQIKNFDKKTLLTDKKLLKQIPEKNLK